MTAGGKLFDWWVTMVFKFQQRGWSRSRCRGLVNHLIAEAIKIIYSKFGKKLG